MADFDLVASAVDQLNDVIAKFRLHNLGDFIRVGKVECYCGKRRVQQASSCIIELAAQPRRPRVFRIKSRQGRKRDAAAVDTVCIIPQFVFHPVYFLNWDFRCIGDDGHFHLRRYKRDAVLWQVLEEAAYFGGRDIDVCHQPFAHSLH